jgi:hypothetical protein
MYATDESKKNLFEGLAKHFPDVPRWIVYRTVELASTPGKAFDAIYDLKLEILPIVWNFNKEKWVKERLVLE